MVQLMVFDVPNEVLYTLFGIAVTGGLTVVWSIIKLWFSHYQQKNLLKSHIAEAAVQQKEAKETREKDQELFGGLKNEVARLNGNFEMLIKKISL